MKLSNKLIISFLISIFISILIISFISKTMIDSKFDSYLVEEQQARLQYIADDINFSYKENENRIDTSQIDSYSLLEDIKIEIKDMDLKTIYETPTSTNTMGGGMMGGGMHRRRMNMHHNIPQGNYTDISFPLLQGKDQVAYIIISYIDNSYITDSSMVFKETLSKSIGISALFTIAIGLVISLFLSRSLTLPLLAINNTAREIQKGNLNERSHIKTNTKEISELSNSINYLGESLAKQEDIRRKYAQDISHELRTPLTTLKSHLEAIMDGIWEADEDHLGILMEEIDRLSKLVSELKDSFRAQDLNLVLNKSNFDLSNELISITNTFIPLYSKKGFSIQKNIEEGILIYMDKDKLKQVIYNVLSNSIKYLGENGRLTLSLKKLNHRAILTIEDNGLGIKKEDLPYVFDRFYRVSDDKNKDLVGSGLGLPIVKSIIEAHGGDVAIESSYGLGTKVTISLLLDKK